MWGELTELEGTSRGVIHLPAIKVHSTFHGEILVRLWRSRIALTPSTMSTWIENSDEVTKYVLYFSDLFCFIWRHGYQATSFECSQGLGCFRVPIDFCFLQDICFVLRQAITFFFWDGSLVHIFRHLSAPPSTFRYPCVHPLSSSTAP